MKVLVLGATGFIGSTVSGYLVSQGHQVVGVARHREGFARLGNRVRAVQGDIGDRTSYQDALRGCDASINVVGLLRQRRLQGQTYRRIVVDGTRQWVAACEAAGVRHIVLISANGAGATGTPYQRTKWEAEEAVRQSGLAWTIFRPSLVAGDGGFVKAMERLLSLRVAPVWGKQDYGFQPVDVDDVATAIVRSLESPLARNRLYHLSGPDTFTYRALLEAIAKNRGSRVWFVPLPWFAAYAMGAAFGWLPFFPATLENFRLLRQGNVAPESKWKQDFGIRPRSFEAALRRHRPRLARHDRTQGEGRKLVAH